MHRVPRLVALDQIKPHPCNARTHSRKQVRAIADSIETFGFTTPVLVERNQAWDAMHEHLREAQDRRAPARTRNLSFAEQKEGSDSEITSQPHRAD